MAVSCRMKYKQFFPSLLFKNARVCIVTLGILLPSFNANATNLPISKNNHLLNWIKSNASNKTGLPLSFFIPEEFKTDIYQHVGSKNSIKAIIERTIIEEGLVIYDGALAQMIYTLTDDEENLKKAEKPLEIYWKGFLNKTSSIRAGYPINQFIYNPNSPESVSSNLKDKGRRGFIFRIINAHGEYLMKDPLDGKKELSNFPTYSRIHWEDWKPVAGENAWVVMAALQIYHKKYFNTDTQQYDHNMDSTEIKLAEEITRCALILQAENGGIRMAPIGTFRESTPEETTDNARLTWWYNQISSENNISWYAALRMFYQITGNLQYKQAMNNIEEYFQTAFNPDENYFVSSMSFKEDQWITNDNLFALDVQTWAIAAFGGLKIDEWFGSGTAYKIWQTSKNRSGYYTDNDETLLGVGYTDEHDQISVEWSAGAILSTTELSEYYQFSNPDFSESLSKDAVSMRQGIEQLRMDLPNDKSAYAYSLKRKWIPFGWYSHPPQVLSLASTAWVLFIDTKFNPFYIK